ncbi:ABC transporter permease [Kribbella sp. NPDC050820]|uniref:ABC transporter permease n=1 Tax=Kribbella sp. NPDC050820 TaxID=3155408 RepID=UPI003407A04A
MTGTLIRLAFAGIRSRLLASALTVLLCSAAAATIVLALEVGATARDPWQRTFDAANGAHIFANVASGEDARRIANLPGVAERDDPVPNTNTALIGREDRLQLAALASPPQVGKPVPIDGSTQPGNGIVLERSFADALGLGVGTTISLATPDGSIDLRVVGTAVSPAQPRYPRRNPGLAWITPATLELIQPDSSRWRWTEAVRLTDPAAAAAFAERAAATAPPGTTSFETWQDQRDSALQDAAPTRLVLTTYTIVLLAVVFAVVAILVAARASAQHREIGLLKAIGVTPRQVTVVFALESAALGMLAVAIGFAVGVVLAPQLAASSGATMLGSPTIAANPWHLLVAALPVLIVLIGSASSSTRRSTRFSTMHAIQAGAPVPAGRSRLARLTSRLALPVPLSLGLKDLLTRRHRAVRLAVAIAVTGSAVVFALSMEASLQARTPGTVSDVPRELPVLVYTLDAVLLLITATTLVAVALLSVRERVRDYGVLKTIGLTPRQIAGSLISAHTAVAVLAAIVSIPIGIALYVVVYAIAGGSPADRVIAPWWWLALVPVGTVLLVVLATSLPARLATRIPAADALRYE